MKYVKSPEWLHMELQNPQLRIADCRFSLNDPLLGERQYKEGHIPGAVRFDLDKDLSGPVENHGGRHPLPDLAELKEKLERAGINEEKTVIAYDNGEGCFAARFWWLLRYLGHEQVYILDGGFKAWEDNGYNTASDLPEFNPEVFSIQLKPEIAASIDEVKALSSGGDGVLVDSREQRRFNGEIEPIDRIPGHIPGAVNKVWTEGFENGYWKGLDEQRERFKDLNLSQKIIVYCGSGVTAAPNVLALKEAGFKNVKLYAGSYSDWISYPDHPVEKS